MAFILLHGNNGWVLSESLTVLIHRKLAHEENLSFKCPWGLFERLTFAFVTPRAQQVSNQHWCHSSTLTADNASDALQSNILQNRYVVQKRYVLRMLVVYVRKTGS